MIDQRLFMYIEQELKRGVPKAAIKNSLREAGWSEDAIEEAFIAVQNRNAPPSPKTELPEAAVNFEKTKIKKIKTKTRKLSLVAIITIVGIVAIVLAAGWYFVFIAPEHQTQSFDETKPTILKNTGVDKSQTTDSGETENATTTTSNETGGELTAVSSDQSAQSLPPTAGNTATETTIVSINDTKRKEDLDKLAEAQKLWFGEHGSYYTCSLTAGDCGGKAHGFPEQIGAYLSNIEQDPLFGNYTAKKAVCGTDFVYCGLNNVPYSSFFCYYAKLDDGRYYTVSQAGSAVRSAVPKVFEQCGVAE